MNNETSKSRDAGAGGGGSRGRAVGPCRVDLRALLVVSLAGCLACVVKERAQEPEASARATSTPSRATSEAREASEPEAPVQDPTHTLTLSEPARLPGGDSLVLADVTIETIEAAPDDPESYPAGAGVTATLRLERGSSRRELVLSRLSEGYESRLSGWLDGYRVTLIELDDLERAPSARVLVERATDRLSEAPAVTGRVRKGGALAIDARLSMRFVAHGHKRVEAGESSPLMVHVQWEAQGEESVEDGGNLGPARADLRWTWRDLHVMIEEYQYDEWMAVTVRRLVLERVEAEASD